ncbi:gamma-glutamyl phosphate reductase [Pseudomonas nitritireducens]|uniref:Gamma-glutamyl phosphate reductase n=1 Tax=Pseudomonas nitroreducens TaxID=46680 RepID=A0A7W7NZT0_PSENT|nr:hypothetical protein [Pseudomonas nitritireducens]MBB4861547.1 gamma-glutamyl phosphate reductase [Pseudomonas nitritireducens]
MILESVSLHPTAIGKPLLVARVAGLPNPLYFPVMPEQHLRSGLAARKVHVPVGMVILPAEAQASLGDNRTSAKQL